MTHAVYMVWLHVSSHFITNGKEMTAYTHLFNIPLLFQKALHHWHLRHIMLAPAHKNST